MQGERVQEERAKEGEIQGVQTRTTTKAGTRAVTILENKTRGKKTQEAEIEEE